MLWYIAPSCYLNYWWPSVLSFQTFLATPAASPDSCCAFCNWFFDCMDAFYSNTDEHAHATSKRLLFKAHDILNAWTRFTATPMNTFMPPEINNYLIIHVCVRSIFKTATRIDTHVQPEIIRHFNTWTLSMVIWLVVSNISCNAIYHCSSQACFWGYRVWWYLPKNHSTVYW